MQTLDYYFPNSKNKEYGSKYLVLDTVENPQTRHYLKLRCKDCDYEFSQRANSVFLGVVSCKCSKSYRKSVQEYLEEISALGEAKNFSFKFIDVKKPYTKSRVTLNCGVCDNDWVTPVGSLIHNGSGCVYCAGHYQPTNEEYLTKIGECLASEFELLSVEHSSRINKTSKVTVKCNTCEKLSVKQVAAIIYHKPSCPCCAPWGFDPSLENIMYLIKLHNSKEIFYKIGVTCHLQRRMKELSRNNDMTVEVLSYWTYKPYSLILEHEQRLKQYFSIGRQEVKPLKDGYTEIVQEESLPIIIAVQNLQYKEVDYGFAS